MYRLITLKFVFFLFFFNQIAFSKSLPPGTGAGDVPVNILLLLDTSQSMEHKELTGEGIDKPTSLISLDSGVLVGQSPGVEKYLTDEKIKDITFNENKKIFIGGPKDQCQVGGEINTNFGSVYSMAVSKRVKDIMNEEIIYIATHSHQKVVAIKQNGECYEVIDRVEMGFEHGSHPTDSRRPISVTIRGIETTINDATVIHDHLLVTGREQWCKVPKKK